MFNVALCQNQESLGLLYDNVFCHIDMLCSAIVGNCVLSGTCFVTLVFGWIFESILEPFHHEKWKHPHFSFVVLCRYVIKGRELLSQIKNGDIIESAKLISGEDKLVIPL